MNINEIKSLAQIMEETGLTSLRVTEGDIEIKLERNPGSVPAVPVPAPIPPIPAPIPEQKAQSVQPEPIPVPEQVVDFNHIIEMKSPMVGVFYAAPSPDAEPFVHVGSKVKKGDVLCIIEAMKLMNEITAEQDGEIVDICVSSGQVVEYSQTLFKLF